MEKIKRVNYSGKNISDYDFKGVESHTIIMTRSTTWDGLAKAINDSFGYSEDDDCFYTVDDLKALNHEGTLVICEDGVAVCWL